MPERRTSHLKALIYLLAAALSSACSDEPSHLEGDQNISLPDQLADLDGITHIDGTLILNGALLGAIELPELQTVRDELIVQGTGIETLALPALERVGGLVVEDNSQLRSIEVPVLSQVQPLSPSYVGPFGFGDNALLTEVTAPALTLVSGSIHLFGDALEAVYLPKLQSAWELEINSSGLSTLEVPELKQLTYFWVHRSAEALHTLALPNLLEISADMYIFGDALTTLTAPQLKTVNLGSVHSQLANLDLSLLQQAGHLSLCTAQLEQLALPALERAQSLSIFCDSPLLEAVHLPSLASIGELDLSGVALQTIDLDALEDAAMVILYETALTSVSLPSLLRTTHLELTDNPQLTDFDAPNLTELGFAKLIDNHPDLACLTTDDLFPALMQTDPLTFELEECP